MGQFVKVSWYFPYFLNATTFFLSDDRSTSPQTVYVYEYSFIDGLLPINKDIFFQRNSITSTEVHFNVLVLGMCIHVGTKYTTQQ